MIYGKWETTKYNKINIKAILIKQNNEKKKLINVILLINYLKVNYLL